MLDKIKNFLNGLLGQGIINGNSSGYQEYNQGPFGTTGNNEVGQYQPTQQTTPTPTPQQIMDMFEKMTYYLPTGNLTATGTVPKSGYSAAISRNMVNEVPMGSLVKLPNGGIVRVEDYTANDILNRLDLFYDIPQQAYYPTHGMMQNVPYQIVGKDTTGMKYNY